MVIAEIKNPYIRKTLLVTVGPPIVVGSVVLYMINQFVGICPGVCRDYRSAWKGA